MEEEASMDWFYSSNPKRPFLIEWDIQKLQKNQPVTSILSKQSFKGKLEDVLKGHIAGSSKSRQKQEALRKLQENVLPAPPELHQSMPPLSYAGTIGGFKVRPIDDLKGIAGDDYSVHERIARCKLASFYRLFERFGWSQLIYDHITFFLPGEINYYLINAFGLHCSEVTASNLVKVDSNGSIVDPGSTQLGINKEGFALHSAIYSARPDIRCIVHVNAIAGAAVSAMRCGLMQLSQESIKVGSVSYHKYTNITNDTNRRQLLTDLGPVNKVLFLHNHGLLAMGRTVEEAFGVCYNVMRACEIQVQTLSAGRDFALVIRDDAVREFATRNKEINSENYELEFEAMMRLLDHLGYDTGYPYRRQKLLHQPTVASKGGRDDVSKSRTEDEELKILSNNIRKEINRIREERKQEQQAYYEKNSQFQAALGMYVTGHSSTSMHQSIPLMTHTGIAPQNQGQHSKPTATNDWSFLDNRIADSSPTGFRKSIKNRQHVPVQLSTSQPQPFLPSTSQPQPFLPSTSQPQPFLPPTSQPQPFLPSTSQPLFQLTSQPVAPTAEQTPLVYSPQLTAPPPFSSGPALPLHYPASTLTTTLHIPITSSLTSEASLPFTSGQTTSFSLPSGSQPFPPLHPPASLLTASSSSYFPQSFSPTQSPASLTQSSNMTHSFPASSVAMLHIPSSSSDKVFSPPAISLVSHSAVPSSDPGSKIKEQPHFMERVQFNPHVNYVSDDDTSPPEGQFSSSADNEAAAASWSRKLQPSSSSSSTSSGSPAASPPWQPKDINGRLEKVKVKAKDVARSTGQSAERLASHMKKKQQQQGAHSSSSSSMASLSSDGSIKDKSTLTSGDIDVNDYDDEITKKLKGLDKVIHTAEQVAQSTGESVEKLSKNLVQSPKLLKT